MLADRLMHTRIAGGSALSDEIAKLEAEVMPCADPFSRVVTREMVAATLRMAARKAARASPGCCALSLLASSFMRALGDFCQLTVVIEPR